MKKLMTMAQAKEKLMNIAGEEYHAITYKMTDYGNGRADQECTVYINNKGSHQGNTWEAAFFQLDQSMSDLPTITENLPISSNQQPTT